MVPIGTQMLEGMHEKNPPASHIEHYCISTHGTQQQLLLNAHSVQVLS